jgi:hypothetical protein
MQRLDEIDVFVVSCVIRGTHERQVMERWAEQERVGGRGGGV